MTDVHNASVTWYALFCTVCTRQSWLCGGEKIPHTPAFDIVPTFPVKGPGPTKSVCEPSETSARPSARNFVSIVCSGRLKSRMQKWITLYLWLCQLTRGRNLAPFVQNDSDLKYSLFCYSSALWECMHPAGHAT